MERDIKTAKELALEKDQTKWREDKGRKRRKSKRKKKLESTDENKISKNHRIRKKK